MDSFFFCGISILTYRIFILELAQRNPFLLLGFSQDTVMRKRFLYVLGICMLVLCIGRSIVLPVKRSKTAQNKPLPAHVRGF